MSTVLALILFAILALHVIGAIRRKSQKPTRKIIFLNGLMVGTADLVAEFSASIALRNFDALVPHHEIMLMGVCELTISDRGTVSTASTRVIPREMETTQDGTFLLLERVAAPNTNQQKEQA